MVSDQELHCFSRNKQRCSALLKAFCLSPRSRCSLCCDKGAPLRQLFSWVSQSSDPFVQLVLSAAERFFLSHCLDSPPRRFIHCNSLTIHSLLPFPISCLPTSLIASDSHPFAGLRDYLSTEKSEIHISNSQWRSPSFF